MNKTTTNVYISNFDIQQAAVAYCSSSFWILTITRYMCLRLIYVYDHKNNINFYVASVASGGTNIWYVWNNGICFLRNLWLFDRSACEIVHTATASLINDHSNILLLLRKIQTAIIVETVTLCFSFCASNGSSHIRYCFQTTYITNNYFEFKRCC